MRIYDSNGVHEATDHVAIRTVLVRRYGSGTNEFWLYHGSEKYPTIWILAKGDLTSLHYLPNEGHPGFRSVGRMEGLEPGGFSKFYINGVTEEHEVLNDSIVPFSTALAVAEEFSVSKVLPKSVEWFEL